MSESPVNLLAEIIVQPEREIHTGIEDGHDGAAEELTASSAQLNLDWY